MAATEETWPAPARVPGRRRIRSFPSRSVVNEALQAYQAGDPARCERLLGGLLAQRTGGVVPIGRVPAAEHAGSLLRLGAWESPEDVAWALIEAAWVQFRLQDLPAGAASLQRCHEDLEGMRARRA